MSLTKVSGFLIFSVLVFGSCAGPTGGGADPVVTMSAEEAAKVVAAAGTKAQSASSQQGAQGTSRVVVELPDTETTVDNPDGGSMTIKISWLDGKMKMETTYKDMVVKVEGETYTLNGGMVINMVEMLTNFNMDTGVMTINMTMTMKGTMNITKKGAVFTQTADLEYKVSSTSTNGVSSGTVSIKGTVGGQAINETQTM